MPLSELWSRQLATPLSLYANPYVLRMCTIGPIKAYRQDVSTYVRFNLWRILTHYMYMFRSTQTIAAEPLDGPIEGGN